jgi:hypothetical protein
MASRIWQTGEEGVCVPAHGVAESHACGLDDLVSGLSEGPQQWTGSIRSDLAAPLDRAMPASVLELPAPPGSAALCLWALGCLGATWMGKSACHLHLSHAPMWFHTAAPSRIGHAWLIQLDRNDLPACDSDEPAGEHILCRFVLRQTPLGPRVRDFLTAAGTRGPPRAG